MLKKKNFLCKTFSFKTVPKPNKKILMTIQKINFKNIYSLDIIYNNTIVGIIYRNKPINNNMGMKKKNSLMVQKFYT